jgi:hypothetical protein
MVLLKNPAETVNTVIAHKTGNFANRVGRIGQQFLGPAEAEVHQILIGGFVVYLLKAAGELPDAQHTQGRKIIYQNILHVIIVDIKDRRFYPAVLPGYGVILNKVMNQGLKNTVQQFPAV